VEEQQQGTENNARCDRSPSCTPDDLGNDSLKYVKEETEMEGIVGYKLPPYYPEDSDEDGEVMGAMGYESPEPYHPEDIDEDGEVMGAMGYESPQLYHPEDIDEGEEIDTSGHESPLYHPGGSDDEGGVDHSIEEDKVDLEQFMSPIYQEHIGNDNNVNMECVNSQFSCDHEPWTEQEIHPSLAESQLRSPDLPSILEEESASEGDTLHKRSL